MTALSEEGWAKLLLVDMGAPDTPNNEGNLMRWMTAEEPTSDWYDRNNPLNSGAGTDSVDGLGTYPSLQSAASTDASQLMPATVSGGADSAGSYAGIYDALMHNAPTPTFATAVEASPWASSHYAGDPIDAIPVPTGTVTAPGSTSTSSTSTSSTTLKTPSLWTVLTNPGKAGAEIVSDVESVASTLVLVLAGLGLVVLGAYKTTSPGPSSKTKTVPKLAKLAAGVVAA